LLNYFLIKSDAIFFECVLINVLIPKANCSAKKS